MVLECQICGYTILSEKHRESCNTVEMWQSSQQDINPKFKPMMTYGLNGCTAAFMIVKDNNQFIKSMMIHDPEKHKVMNYLKTKLLENKKFQTIVVVRSPGEYQEVNSRYEMVPIDLEYWDKFLGTYSNCEYTIEGYSLSKSCGVNYDAALHLKLINNYPHYTDTWGRWISIEAISTPELN